MQEFGNPVVAARPCTIDLRATAKGKLLLGFCYSVESLATGYNLGSMQPKVGVTYLDP